MNQEFNSKPLASRMAIVAAGPIFNLIFTVAAFWVMLMVGKPDYLPVLDTPTNLAQQAGFKAGDQILSVDGRPIDSWSRAVLVVAENAIAQRDVTVNVREANGRETSHLLKLSQLPVSAQGPQLLEQIGISLKPRDVPSVVDQVVANRPAKLAGMQAGDRITAINGLPVTTFKQINELIQQEAAKNAVLTMQIQRAGQSLSLSVIAERVEVKNPKIPPGSTRWVVGIAGPDPHDALLRYNPLSAIPAAFTETWDAVASTFRLLKLMVTGQASSSNISGIVSIAQYANDSAKMGFAWFLNFLAMISVGLAIMNLLPIPVLDGGHLMYYLIELVKGSPVSERVMIAGQYVGLALLVSLMGLAFYNDIVRLVAS